MAARAASVSHTDAPLELLLTGFGPFVGVADNPTQHHVRAIASLFRQEVVGAEFGLVTARLRAAMDLVDARVVETSIPGCNAYFQSIDKLLSEREAPLLHDKVASGQFWRRSSIA